MHRVMMAFYAVVSQNSKYAPFSDIPSINIHDINKYMMSDIRVPVALAQGLI